MCGCLDCSCDRSLEISLFKEDETKASQAGFKLYMTCWAYIATELGYFSSKN